MTIEQASRILYSAGLLTNIVGIWKFGMEVIRLSQDHSLVLNTNTSSVAAVVKNKFKGIITGAALISIGCTMQLISCWTQIF